MKDNYRTVTLAQLRRHAPGTPPAILERIEHGDQQDAAVLVDQALEELARRLPPGTVRRHRKYGCRFEITPGGLVLRQGACEWAKMGHWCKHEAEEIGDGLDEMRLAALSAELGPGPIQPPSCGRCSDQIHDGGPCPNCGNLGNVVTVRAKEGPDPPGGLNR